MNKNNNFMKKIWKHFFTFFKNIFGQKCKEKNAFKKINFSLTYLLENLLLRQTGPIPKLSKRVKLAPWQLGAVSTRRSGKKNFLNIFSWFCKEWTCVNPKMDLKMIHLRESFAAKFTFVWTLAFNYYNYFAVCFAKSIK